MSGYQRFIAYVYEYQKEKKADNCGFLKVEVKNSVCRVEIHLHCPGLPPEIEAETYGFFRKDGLMNGILLGNCQTKADTLDCAIECDAQNLGNTHISFDSIGGIAVLTKAGSFFGTEWDDQPIRPENFKEFVPRSPAESPGEILPSVTPETAPEQEPVILPEVPAAAQPAESKNEISSDIAEKQERESLSNNVRESKTETQNQIQLTEASAEPQALQLTEASAKPQTLQLTEEAETQSLYFPPKKEKAPTSAKASAAAIRQPYSFPGEEFSPFDDEAFLRCWKIRPNDLIRCAPGVRTLRNNRFLQYGFYNFGHLLLGVRPGGKYILGVPGGYDQQERFMANMFGFPYFRESPMIELPRNRGGYWYRSINTPNFH